MKKNFWKIVSGVAASAAGRGLMTHWGPLGFAVAGFIAAMVFSTKEEKEMRRMKDTRRPGIDQGGEEGCN